MVTASYVSPALEVRVAIEFIFSLCNVHVASSLPGSVYCFVAAMSHTGVRRTGEGGGGDPV